MRAMILGVALSVNCLFMVIGAAAESGTDDRCLDDSQAVEGWYLTDHRRGGSVSYLMLQKKQQRDQDFFLCRLEGESRHFVRELGIEVDFAASHLEAARCTPVESGVPGNEYFSVLDNRTSRLLRVYRFDAMEEDVEQLPTASVVCSALPAS
jgi:hypothetical protein